MEKHKIPSKPLIIVRAMFTILFMLAAIFVPAGTLKWPEAWLFLIFYFSTVTWFMIWMKRHSPGLLRERMSRKKDVKSWDKKFMWAYLTTLIPLAILPGLDAVRLQWSSIPLTVKTGAFLGFFPAMGIIFWAMRENAYLSDVVRIQEDRGHKVCTTGPYRYVRHPMYAGVILIMLCFPLFMGSLFSLIPAVIIAILFVFRTALEDKTLQEELPGYKEYAQKVHYRLVPRVW
jgi:protein-S-isoprenylcysteine O-methyltransferase Ste14